MSQRDMKKNFVTQACLMLAIEHKVNGMLSDCCVACKDTLDIYSFGDHECINPTWYKAFTYAICSDVAQLQPLRDMCYDYFKGYCDKYDKDLNKGTETGPFDGHFNLVIHNKDTINALNDIMNNHMTSTSHQTEAVMTTYYTITNDLLSDVDVDAQVVADFNIDFSSLLMSV